MRGRDAIAILGKRRRIENDHLEAPAHFVVFLQKSKVLPSRKWTFEMRIQLLVPSRSFDGRG